MKIEQEKEFKPIIITFEAKEEAVNFIRGVDMAFNKDKSINHYYGNIIYIQRNIERILKQKTCVMRN